MFSRRIREWHVSFKFVPSFMFIFQNKRTSPDFPLGRWNILFEIALPISPQKISEMQTSDHGLIGHEQHKQHEKVNETCLFLSPWGLFCFHQLSWTLRIHQPQPRWLLQVASQWLLFVKQHDSWEGPHPLPWSKEQRHLCSCGNGNWKNRSSTTTAMFLQLQSVFVVFYAVLFRRDVRLLTCGKCRLGVLQGNCMDLFLMLVVCMTRLQIWIPATWNTLRVFILSHSCRTTLGLWKISWMGLVCPSGSCGWTTFCLALFLKGGVVWIFGMVLCTHLSLIPDHVSNTWMALR